MGAHCKMDTVSCNETEDLNDDVMYNQEDLSHSEDVMQWQELTVKSEEACQKFGWKGSVHFVDTDCDHIMIVWNAEGALELYINGSLRCSSLNEIRINANTVNCIYSDPL